MPTIAPKEPTKRQKQARSKLLRLLTRQQLENICPLIEPSHANRPDLEASILWNWHRCGDDVRDAVNQLFGHAAATPEEHPYDAVKRGTGAQAG